MSSPKDWKRLPGCPQIIMDENSPRRPHVPQVQSTWFRTGGL